MLAKTARISNSADFAKATKSGLRSTTNSLVGYLHLSNSGEANLPLLPKGSLLVIRALPASNTAELKTELTELISKLVNKAEQKTVVKS